MSGGGMESIARPPPSTNNLGCGGTGTGEEAAKERFGIFQMPLHYPRYTKAEYEGMAEWKLDCLLAEYGLYVNGDVNHKRKFAMGAFLWT
ncbi:hypothetical protein ACJIZ3_018531 [Penstemon smallii]|uniref:DUF7722 domain-containing protein n=1 Tax=Penstemon smallii TaxID=265156 RepID=A0ABD3SYP2_9LAMI